MAKYRPKTNIVVSTSNVKVGDEFKSFAEMCDALGVDSRNGASRGRIANEISRYIDYEVEKRKHTIVNIHKPPKDRVDRRRDGNSFIEYENFLVPKRYMNRIGVYQIRLDNKIYIGSTIVGFRSRFMQHMSENNTLMPRTREMLLNGGLFSVVEYMDNCTEQEIRSRESEYISSYTESNYWNCINERMPDSSNKENMKTIRIKESFYEEAILLLRENGLID